jgi:hypothetical protein
MLEALWPTLCSLVHFSKTNHTSLSHQCFFFLYTCNLSKTQAYKRLLVLPVRVFSEKVGVAGQPFADLLAWQLGCAEACSKSYAAWRGHVP